MRKGILCRRLPVVCRAVLSLLLVGVSALGASAAGPFPFEDVNNNGVFDPGVDRDLTEVLTPDEWYVYYSTPHSIVIPEGVTFLKSVAKFTGYYLVAGKNITVKSSINSAIYAGMVDLQALGGNVTIGPRVTFNGRDYVSVFAGGSVTVGDGAAFVANGGSANMGSINVRANTGDIALGNGVKVVGLRDVFLTAVNGDVTVGTGLQLDAPIGQLLIDGDRVTVNGAKLRASDMSITGGGAPLEFKGNRVMLPREGDLHITNPKSTVDVTGTKLPKAADSVFIQASHIFQ